MLIDELNLKDELKEFIRKEFGEVESLKIIKNTKGFNWEFKLVGKVEEQIKRIIKINEELETILRC